MGHTHSVYDTDSHFKVSATTRAITDVSNSKTSIVQYDHDSERFTFEIPRYIEGHDMLLCNDVEILWQNGSAKGKYAVDDFQASPEDDNVVICSWLISREATQYTGVLQFQIRLSCITETEPDYVWNTTVYSKINVLRGFSNDDESAGSGVNNTISIIRGTTKSIDIKLADDSGGAYILQSGEVLRFGVKTSAEQIDYILVKTLTAANLNSAGDAYTLTLMPTDTEEMEFRRYCYDVGLQSGDDYYNVIPCSDFIVEHNITNREE